VLLVLISRRLGWSEQGYGVLIAAAGAGGVLGGLTAGRLSARCSLRRIVAGSLLLIALCLLLLAVAPSMAAAAVLAAAGGAAATVTEIFTETVLQRQLEEAVFAKAYGFAFPVAIAGIAVGSMIAAPLVGLFGLNGALAAIGIAVASFALFLGRSLAPRAGTPAADRATAAQLAAVG
jgi:predicted MFS family arabinose efflux permease